MDDEYQVSCCIGKSAMPAAVAKKVAKRMSQRGRTVSAYLCPICAQWHVGSPRRRKTIKHYTTRLG